MPGRRVLVAYGSKYGATGGIAERIGETLRRKGLEADVLRASEVRDLTPYDAAVLGSGVYAGNWLKEAANLLTSQEAWFAAHPVWLFSDGPTGEGDPVEQLKGWRFPQGLQPVADRIKPRDVAVFHGAMDPDKMSLPEKLIIRALKAPTGDFRDWQAIEAWAEAIATAVG
ncbi:MAG: flavodoxin domain-containing protein [Thiobacillaceae bacterium]